MIGVWAGALALAGGVVGAISFIPLDRAWPQLAAAEIVFIGSSQTVRAISSERVPGGLLEDGRAHTRLAAGGLSEAQSNELLRAVLRYPVREIFVEIGAYVRAFYASPEPPPPPWTEGLGGAAAEAWSDAGRRLRDKAGMLVGQQPVGIWGQLIGEPTDLNDIYDGNHRYFDGYYPLDIHQPRRPDELDAALAEARRKGIRPVFFATPRSVEASEYIGPKVRSALADTYAEFSRRFGVEVWLPAEAWPNEYFVDHAHMNGRGRERFVEALRDRFGPH